MQTFWMTCFGLGFGRGGLARKKKRKPKTKKQCIGEPSPLPHPKVGLPLFCVFSVLGTPPLPKPNPKQVIQNVCMFIPSVVGERWRANHLNIYMHRYLGGLSTLNSISMRLEKACLWQNSFETRTVFL